jgi:two-component system KDP operon response regulator KdpE
MAPPRASSELQLDLIQPRVRLGGHEVKLTLLEYRTLWVLSQGRGAVVAFSVIERHVWGDTGKRRRHALSRLVRSLRDKLTDGSVASVLLLTEPRVGYRLCPTTLASAPQ